MFTKYGDEFEVKVEDLTNGSHALVKVQCDGINCKNPYLNPIEWKTYIKHVHDDGKYYCLRCANKLYGGETRRIIALENGKSFKQWCIDNNCQDVLDRWDYNLNNCKPNEIGYSSNNKCYIKCPRGLHKSELKSINDFTNNHSGVMDCKRCNSFAQFLINTFGENALNLYWDDKLNNINPWDIDKSANKNIYIKCQEKNYHGSYNIIASGFTRGNRCPYCINHRGKVHLLDSLGTLYPEVLNVWSNKNKKSPYEYAPMSHNEVWWKCPDGKHEDFPRIISNSKVYKFRCPQCQFSEGEKCIEDWVLNNNIIFIPQKEFSGLLGLGGKNLSYDFYLPNYNLLIEFQGEQHERYIKGIHKSKKDFQRQQEHDRRKREYAIQNNINLLEIWYWDYDNIEKILKSELLAE